MAPVPTSIPTESQRGLTLRDWQQDASRIACEWWQHEPEPALICAVMGAGKTHFTGAICRAWFDTLAHRECVVILVPTENLVLQTAMEIRGEWLPPGKVGVFYGKEKEPGPVTICTYKSATTLARRLAEMRWSVRFVLSDEAHQTENSLGHAALDCFPGAPLLGLSATPYRSRKKDSLQKFEKQLYRYGPEDGLRDGILVYFETHSAEVDFDSDDCDDVCVDMARQAVAYGPMVCNAVSIQDAEDFAARLTADGIPAKALSSRTQGNIHTKGSDSWRIIDHLKRGKIQCVVYPTLLSEGINLPWLVSLLMRRKISSRVRFAQESGRVLRAAPGKDKAHIWDPHDLTNALSISYDAALGWVEPDPAELLQEAIDSFDRPALEKLGEDFPYYPPAKKLPLTAAFVRRLANAWRQAGALRRMRAARWRQMEPTPGHIKALHKYRSGFEDLVHDSPEHGILTACFDAAPEFDRGTLTDLLELFHNGIYRQRDVWPRGWTHDV